MYLIASTSVGVRPDVDMVDVAVNVGGVTVVIVGVNDCFCCAPI